MVELIITNILPLSTYIVEWEMQAKLHMNVINKVMFKAINHCVPLLCIRLTSVMSANNQQMIVEQ